MKLATPMGVLSGKSEHVSLPAVVLMIAVGSLAAVAGFEVVVDLAAVAGLAVVDFAGAVWAQQNPYIVGTIRSTRKTLGMKAPQSYLFVIQLYLSF
jgi:hypothetical protein